MTQEQLINAVSVRSSPAIAGFLSGCVEEGLQQPVDGCVSPQAQTAFLQP